MGICLSGCVCYGSYLSGKVLFAGLGSGFWNLDSRLISVHYSPFCICDGCGFLAGTGKIVVSQAFFFYRVLQKEKNTDDLRYVGVG